MQCAVEIGLNRYYRELSEFDDAWGDAEKYVNQDFRDIMNLGHDYAELWVLCGGNDNGAEGWLYDTLERAWNNSNLHPYQPRPHDFQDYVPYKPGQTVASCYNSTRAWLINHEMEKV